MIVVIGPLRLRGPDADAEAETEAAGLAAAVAAAAAREGAPVEVIARVGDDPAGDALLLALARQRVGHVTVLRDPARATRIVAAAAEEGPDPEGPDPEGEEQLPAGGGVPAEPVLEAADVNLALRYLPQIGVIVAIHLAADVLAEAIAAASWAETALVVIVPAGAPVPDGLPEAAVILEIDDADESAAGAAVGRYAAALDRGVPAREAYDGLVASMAG